MRGQVAADLTGVVVETVADALPREVADDGGRHVEHDPIDRRRVAQVGGDEREAAANIGDAPRVTARAHDRRRVDPSGDEAASDVRAEETGRSSEEDSHRR